MNGTKALAMLPCSFSPRMAVPGSVFAGATGGADPHLRGDASIQAADVEERPQFIERPFQRAADVLAPRRPLVAQEGNNPGRPLRVGALDDADIQRLAGLEPFSR